MGRHREYEKQSAWRKAHYEGADTNDKLIFNLRDLSHTMRFLYEGKGSQKRIMIILDEIGGSITQRRLTECLGIQPGSVSEVIAKMESSRIISRTPNILDHRTADIRLTERGKVLAAEAREQREHRHEQMFSCLSDTEKKELLALLEKVNSDWEVRYRNLENLQEKHRHHQERGKETHEGE